MRLATRLPEEPDVGDDHVLGDGLAHVVDREQRHRHRRQSLHLHAGLPAALDAARIVLLLKNVRQSNWEKYVARTNYREY